MRYIRRDRHHWARGGYTTNNRGALYTSVNYYNLDDGGLHEGHDRRVGN